MSRNHVKLLTETQRIDFKNRYDFELVDDMILAKVIGYGKVTPHRLGLTFTINARAIRRLSFTVEAQYYWKRLLELNQKEHLVDVQQAVNILSVTYQHVSLEAVKRVLISFGKIQTNKET